MKSNNVVKRWLSIQFWQKTGKDVCRRTIGFTNHKYHRFRMRRKLEHYMYKIWFIPISYLLINIVSMSICVRWLSMLAKWPPPPFCEQYSSASSQLSNSLTMVRHRPALSDTEPYGHWDTTSGIGSARYATTSVGTRVDADDDSISTTFVSDTMDICRLGPSAGAQ